MFFNGPFRLSAIISFVRSVWPFRGRSQSQRSSSRPVEKLHVRQSVLGSSASTTEGFTSVRVFWNWSGSYVGYRASDGLFHMDGRQIGHFAEGDEIYGCHGEYLGEVRRLDRLITNLSKKAWARETWVPQALKRSVGHSNVKPMEMLPGYEDFPVPSR